MRHILNLLVKMARGLLEQMVKLQFNAVRADGP